MNQNHEILEVIANNDENIGILYTFATSYDYCIIYSYCYVLFYWNYLKEAGCC
jgi:hypothetical protein